MAPSDRLRVMVVFGTRPEIVKMAPVVRALEDHPDQFTVSTLLTAQHRELSDELLPLFGIVPTHDLDLMRHRQPLPGLTASVIEHVHTVLERDRPDLVLVQGDTVTVFATALAAFYAGIPVGHVEAGLRTGNRRNPYPEEMMRRLTGPIAELHFAPTAQARDNLLGERVDPASIYLVGNTVIDALIQVSREERPPSDGLVSLDLEGRRLILVTAHRRENWGRPLEQINTALRRLAESFEDVAVVYAIHPNPEVVETAERILSGAPRVELVPAPHYGDFVALMNRAELVLTDSGGVQEEAPSLGKPVLVMRETTERPEGITAGTARLVGIETEAIVAAATELLTDAATYDNMAQRVNPYGDGHSAERIVGAIGHALAGGTRPIDFVPAPDRASSAASEAGGG